jgi:hypothetical protein
VNFLLIPDLIATIWHDPNFVDGAKIIMMKKRPHLVFLLDKPFGFDPELQTPDNITDSG